MTCSPDAEIGPVSGESHSVIKLLVIAIASRDLFSGAVIAIIDQAMLSALNLLIGLAIIRLGEKLDYGIYVQLFTLLLLAQSLQDAAINAPMVALAPQHRALIHL